MACPDAWFQLVNKLMDGVGMIIACLMPLFAWVVIMRVLRR